jgi:hypothetical protein
LTLYFTSGDAKGNKTTFFDKRAGGERPLPSWTTFNHISLCAIGKPFSQLSGEEKMIKLWNSATSSEEPTTVMTLPELMGKKVLLGLYKIRENKRVKDASGNYVDTAEERLFNEISKVFHAESRRTVGEAKAGMSTGEFIDKWAAKHQGNLNDKYKAPKGGTTSAMAAPSSGAAPAAAPDLFATG